MYREEIIMFSHALFLMVEFFRCGSWSLAGLATNKGYSLSNLHPSQLVLRPFQGGYSDHRGAKGRLAGAAKKNGRSLHANSGGVFDASLVCKWSLEDLLQKVGWDSQLCLNCQSWKLLSIGQLIIFWVFKISFFHGETNGNTLQLLMPCGSIQKCGSWVLRQIIGVVHLARWSKTARGGVVSGMSSRICVFLGHGCSVFFGRQEADEPQEVAGEWTRGWCWVMLWPSMILVDLIIHLQTWKELRRIVQSTVTPVTPVGGTELTYPDVLGLQFLVPGFGAVHGTKSCDIGKHSKY